MSNNNTSYQMSYYKRNPEYFTYFQIRDLFKKAALRIRDEAFELRLIPLKEEDLLLKTHLESQFREGMTWKNYNIFWKIVYPNIVEMLRSGKTKQECLDYKITRVSYKG